MTSQEIRNSFLKYFKEHAHTIVASSPVVPYDDPTLLFTNAGMNQFEDVFLNTGKRTYTRAADTQKCIRVSGKHNDLEEVGRDTYHHTFFEMLGNWSFGDYYKKEAISWAWDLLTNVWKLPKDRLWATVYKDDDEAEQLWKTATDINPAHILRFEKENFWEMGETGPCGPCSEIHIDRTLNGTATASQVNAGTPDVIEIWNLVFMQYNRDETGKLNPLPAKHVDTGMGFERVCAVMQNKASNYDTDVFTPIIQAISKFTNKPYNGKLFGIDKNQMETDTAMRVIADHVRTLTFAIGDGALPGNEGRGYVLRRILRRAARFGRTLGMHDPFIYQLVPTLVEAMSYIFPEIKTQKEYIQKIIKGEEESFNATLDRGLELFQSITVEAVRQHLIKSKIFESNCFSYLENDGLYHFYKAPDWDKKEPSKFKIDVNANLEKQIGKVLYISGADAFKLYDTFGFPLDLTELMASERGLKVDVEAFNKLMEEQKERSRTSGKDTAYAGLKFSAESVKAAKTDFLGYSAFETDATIVDLVDGYAVLDKTPFYAESGGQIGDTGVLIANGSKIKVVDTQKDDSVFGHKIEGSNLKVGEKVKAQVDTERRLSIMRNHSATHLLHNALRRILGTHVHQAGSFVGPDYLRFDFAHFAKITDEEIQQIEAMVNEKIKENIPRTPNLNNIPFDDAKKTGALMFFGDKYGDHVNVIQFGDFSTEFCGGTHVNNTGDIQYFKIRSEGSVASGVRRIEAVTGNYALELYKEQEQNFYQRLQIAINQSKELVNYYNEVVRLNGSLLISVQEILVLEGNLNKLKQLPPIPSNSSFTLSESFEKLSANDKRLAELTSQVIEIRKSFEKEIAKSRLQSLSGSIDELVSSAKEMNGIKIVTSKITASTIDELKAFGDSLRSKLGSGIGLLATVIEDKVQLVCVVTDDLVKEKKAEAGKIVGAVAKFLGGGGGGRPHLATAGGKDVSKLDDAIAQTPSIIQSLLKK
jgi:alanyl-tRNA synthetase